jgi:hypothetical protein
VDVFASREDHDTTLRDAEFKGLHDAATKRVDSYKSNDMSGSFAKIDTDEVVIQVQEAVQKLGKGILPRGGGQRPHGGHRLSQTDERLATEIADIKKLHSKDVNFCRPRATAKSATPRRSCACSRRRGELDVATEARVTQEETKENPAIKVHGEKKTRHEGNVNHQGQTIAKETARRVATKKKSVADHDDVPGGGQCEETHRHRA